jgi:hypothetical protein
MMDSAKRQQRHPGNGSSSLTQAENSDCVMLKYHSMPLQVSPAFVTAKVVQFDGTSASTWLFGESWITKAEVPERSIHHKEFIISRKSHQRESSAESAASNAGSDIPDTKTGFRRGRLLRTATQAMLLRERILGLRLFDDRRSNMVHLVLRRVDGRQSDVAVGKDDTDDLSSLPPQQMQHCMM